MKRVRFILILLALLSFTSAFAQTGEIIFMDYEPDTALHVGSTGTPSSIWIDFDQDGLSDFNIYWYYESPGPGVCMCGRDENVMLSVAEEGDSISHLTEWWSGTNYPYLHDNYGIRIKKNGEYCYGWFSIYYDYQYFIFYFDKFAFCTIPDYPLRWGQTELLDVEETENIEFANVQPNPTNGIITVTGEKLRQIEVFDTLGQMITTLQAGSDQTTIDLGGQPAGIYLINVTGQDGKRCVKKVVKQ